MREKRARVPEKIGLLTPFQGLQALEAVSLAQAASDLGAACEIVRCAPAVPSPKGKRDGFGAFLRTHAPLSAREFAHMEELRSAGLSYDLLLSAGTLGEGGASIDPVFLGSFFPRRRAAYGLFLGEAAEGIMDTLAEFSHISFQTEAEQALFRKRTGREAPLVLPPLLLAEERWREIPPAPGGCVLWMGGGEPGVLEPYLRRLAAETDLPVVQTGDGKNSLRRVKRLKRPGPEELLSQFRRAAVVCTDSFLGTALAILFHKPFFTALPPGELAAPETSRAASLLRRLELTERIAGRGDTADLTAPIDWPAVEARLDRLRRESLAQLKAALTNEPAAPAPRTERPRRRLAERNLCTGCTACASICPQDAIAMVRDKEGFAYPAVDHVKCVDCGRCGEVCPVPAVRETRHLPAVFAAWNRDEAVCRDSASGGVFSALADFVLEGGGVVFGAALDGRQRLRHAACFSKEELWRFRGAKFVQSDLGDTFRMVRDCLETRQVLFCGTPCQVAGLYAYLGRRPEGLITCDLVCGGVPSPGLWEDMARSIETRRGKDLQAVRFCNKVTGWRDRHLTLVYDNGTVDSAPLLRTEYGRALRQGLLFRPSCYQCPYTSMSRLGDFTLGDFLGLRPDELPRQQEKGVSLLLVNSTHGSHVFDQLPLVRQAFPVERAIAGNPPLAAPPFCPPERAALFAAYALEPFETVRKRYFARPPLPVRAALGVLSAEAEKRKNTPRKKKGLRKR